MKVFEILRSDISAVSEQQIVERMRSFDWKYEFSDNVRQLAYGAKELEIIENMTYQLWKKNPERAVALWNSNAPNMPSDLSATPSFIYRLQAQEV